MIDTHTSGTVTLYLLTGPHAESLAVLEIESSEIVAATIDGETVDPAEIGREDYEYAIDALIQTQMI